MNYDIKCYDLAARFVNEVDSSDKREAHVSKLAQMIQDLIESYLEDIEP